VRIVNTGSVILKTGVIDTGSALPLLMHAGARPDAARAEPGPVADLLIAHWLPAPLTGPADKRRDEVVCYQYKTDRTRRTLRGIDEQVAKAEKAVAGKCGGSGSSSPCRGAARGGVTVSGTHSREIMLSG
jgi:hypothetical protein